MRTLFSILRNNKKVNQYLDRPQSITLAGSKDFIYNIQKGIQGNKSIYWVISPRCDVQLAGTICLWNISEQDSKEK
jgi:ribosomal-protein-alanine N-acetyltransferase